MLLFVMYWGERSTVSVGAHSAFKLYGVTRSVWLEGQTAGNLSIVPEIVRQSNLALIMLGQRNRHFYHKIESIWINRARDPA